MEAMETTLLFLSKKNMILLALKKRGFGVNKYNGIGGKLEPGETIKQAMVRETKEEINVEPTVYKKMGIINFNEYFKGQPTAIKMHVFVATKWTGEPNETEEMQPKWFDINNIPYDQMWSDDRLWLSKIIIDNKVISAKFTLDINDKITSSEVIELKDNSYLK